MLGGISPVGLCFTKKLISHTEATSIPWILEIASRSTLVEFSSNRKVDCSRVVNHGIQWVLTGCGRRDVGRPCKPGDGRGGILDRPISVPWDLFHVFISRALFRLSPPSRPPAQDNTHTPSRCHSLPPFLSLLRFLCTSGNDDQRLAPAAPHQYALNTVLVSFHSFLLTLLLHFPCTSGTSTTRIPTP